MNVYSVCITFDCLIHSIWSWIIWLWSLSILKQNINLTSVMKTQESSIPMVVTWPALAGQLVWTDQSGSAMASIWTKNNKIWLQPVKCFINLPLALRSNHRTDAENSTSVPQAIMVQACPLTVPHLYHYIFQRQKNTAFPWTILHLSHTLW